MRGALSLAITELDPLWNVPRMSYETEVSYRGRVCDWEITATVDRQVHNLGAALKLGQHPAACEAQTERGRSEPTALAAYTVEHYMALKVIA